MNVLIVAAHPDDEVIGMGGTLRKLANQGARIRLVIFSAGAEGYSRIEEKGSIVRQRAAEVKQVCGILGIGESFNLGRVDWDLRVDNAGYRDIIGHIRQFEPDIVFTHSSADYNDHKAVHDTVLEAWYHAAVPCAMDLGPVWKHVPLYEFEVLQPMAAPSHVVDVSDTYSDKVKAMQVYASQLDLVGGIFQLMDGRAMERGHAIGARRGEAFARNVYKPKRVSDALDFLDARLA